MANNMRPQPGVAPYRLDVANSQLKDSFLSGVDSNLKPDAL